MKTKMKLITAAAAAFACTQAHAYGPTVTPDVAIYIGGGSAQGGAALAFARKLMQNDGNLNTYTDDTTCTADGSNSRAVFGTFISSGISLNGPSGSYTYTPPASLAGKKVFIEYVNNGGTFPNGIDGPVRAHTLTKYQTFLSGNSTACSAGSALGSTYYAVTNTATLESHIPLLGFSDEEIGLFTGLNLPSGSSAVAASEASNYSATGLYENVFGLAEDNVLAAQKTNFSNAEITAIFAGNYSNWNQLTGDVGTFAGQPLPSGAITIVDRSAGSGSKAAYNEFFFNNPGAKTAGQLNPQSTGSFIGDCGSPATSGGGHYDETNGGDCPQSSNGNVKKALDAANGASARAVGILGLEFQPGGSDSYVFASLNGVHVDGSTTKTCGNATAYIFEPGNVVSGAYPLFFTNSLQYRVKSLNSAPYAGDGSVFSDFITAWSDVAADPATEVSVSGVLLDPVVTGAPSGNPWDACITKGTHNLQSTSPLQLQF